MIRPSDIAAADRSTDSVLVVNDGGQVADALRERYPEWKVTTSDTYLSAIKSLSQRPVRAVVACVDASLEDRLAGAVAGLREASGAEARLVLCCQTAGEPAAREAMAAGADDYVLLPLRGDELDEALGYARPETWAVAGADEGEPAAATKELALLGEIVSRLDGSPGEMLGSVAEWVREAFDATGVAVVVEGTVATAGAKVPQPVLVEAIRSGSKSMGQLSVGARVKGAYNHREAERLRHYANLVGRLAEAGVAHRRWRRLALTDELSGLPNRRYLLGFMEDLLSRQGGEATPLTLLLFDIDDLKTYNDEFGHEAGDEIIRGCGELFRRHCREHDVVTRYGGDEFAVVFWDAEAPRVPGSQHPRSVMPVIERFCQALREHRFAKLKLAEEAGLTISGGLASYPWDGRTVDELIVRADEALLRAKREGKNRIYLGGECGREEERTREG